MEKKEYNYGIALLKIILSFFVVLSHFHISGTYLRYTKSLAVPLFMMISFCLTESSLKDGSLHKCIKRIGRIYTPFIFGV